MRRFLVAFVCVIGAQLPTGIHAEPATPDEAVRHFVEQVNEASMSFFSSGSENDAREKCRELLAWAFDVPAMSESVLGAAWTHASEKERKDFLDAFEGEIVTEYLDRMRGGPTMTFVGTRTGPHGDLLAASRVTRPGKNDQTWIWRLRPQGETWRIVDVLVDGRSAISSERETYAQVLQEHDGDMEALIDFVRSRAGP
jgi:phospholipid transport system substrate-binding protein